MLNIILYPGIIFHEFMHLLMCFILGVDVKKIKFGLKESFVEHKATKGWKLFFIAFAPFFLGNFFAILFIIYALKYFWNDFFAFLILNWISISIIYFSIPSKQDTKNVDKTIENTIKKLQNNFLGILLLPFFFIFVFLPIKLLIIITNTINETIVLRFFLLFFIYISIASIV